MGDGPEGNRTRYETVPGARWEAKMRSSTRKEWHVLHEEAEMEAREAMECIRERNELYERGVEAARMSAFARRKLSSLQSKIEALRGSVGDGGNATEQEIQRRMQVISVLDTKHSGMMDSLGQVGRKAKRNESKDVGTSRETAWTAGLETRDIVQMQEKIMKDQDGELEGISRDVSSIKHVAVTINEELGLHQRLLDDLDEDLDYTQRNVKTMQKKIAYIMRKSGGFKSTCFLLMLIVGLVFLLIFVLRIR